MFTVDGLKRAFPYVLIILVCVACYSNTFDVPFQFDDLFYVIDNPTIKDISYFTDPSQVDTNGVGKDVHHYFRTRFIGYLSFFLNYRVGDLDVYGFHMVNLAVHLLNALLVYGLLLLTFRTPLMNNSPFRAHTRGISLLSALLFAAHPVQTEAVTYITQRFASLAALFSLLSLFLYVKWRLSKTDVHGAFEVKGLFLYLGCLASAVLAMKTKETAFTLPFAILFYEFIFFMGDMKRRLFYLVPILLTMLIVPLSVMDFQESMGEAFSKATKTQLEISRETYLFTQIRVLVTYLRLLFLPVNLNLDYNYPLYDKFLALQILLSFLFLSLIIAALMVSLLRFRSGGNAWLGLAAFGGGWFFVTLFVESSIIPLADVIFEHRLYLPSVGVFAATSVGTFALYRRLRGKTSQRVMIAVMASILLLLSASTYARNEIWRSEISLWRDVIEKSPGKARGYNNLGTGYKNHGLYEKAITCYTSAVDLNPDYAEAYTNRGITFGKSNQYRQAIRDFNRAIELNPNYVDAYLNRGVVFYHLEKYEEAALDQNNALEIEPNNAIAYYNRGTAYISLGQPLQAVQDYSKAIELNPDYADAYNNRGLIYMSMLGEKAKGCEDWKHACELNTCENYALAKSKGICN